MKNLTRLSVDFVVIVIGVFIALAAETWWSEREDRQFEAELREDMTAEFATNIEILEADIAENELAIDLLTDVATLSDLELVEIPGQTLQENVDAGLRWAGFDPAMGSAQALVESGNVGAIDDRELRLLMANWAGLLESNRRFNFQTVQFDLQVLVPRMAAASADQNWSESDRFEIRNLVGVMADGQTLVADNQKQLLETARDIHQYLQSE